MGAVDDLQLRVVPGGDLEALVLAVADLDRRLVESLAGIGGGGITSQSPSCLLV
jgi:hypothetical protein